MLPDKSRISMPATLLLVGLALLIRKSTVFFSPQFFAEDACFYTDALVLGPSAMLRPFVGYHHLALRLVAEFAVHFDPLFTPAFFIAGSVLGSLAVAAACFSPRIDLGCRPFFALATVLVPHTGEVFANLATLNFVLALGLLLLLLADDPRTFLQWFADLCALVVLGLSGPFIVLWLPLFLWRFAQRRSPAAGVVAGLSLLLSTVHLAAYLKDSARGFPGTSPWTLWLRVPWQRAIGDLLFPAPWSERCPLLFLLAIGLVFAGLLAWFAGTAASRREQRWVLLAAAALSIAPVLYKFRGELSQLAFNQNGDRYFYLPKVILLWLLAHEFGRAGWRQWIAGTLFVCGLLSNTRTFRWNEPYHDCDWPHYAAIIRRGDAVTVPVNPPGWTMPLPDRARRAR